MEMLVWLLVYNIAAIFFYTFTFIKQVDDENLAQCEWCALYMQIGNALLMFSWLQVHLIFAFAYFSLSRSVKRTQHLISDEVLKGVFYFLTFANICDGGFFIYYGVL